MLINFLHTGIGCRTPKYGCLDELCLGAETKIYLVIVVLTVV